MKKEMRIFLQYFGLKQQTVCHSDLWWPGKRKIPECSLQLVLFES